MRQTKTYYKFIDLLKKAEDTKDLINQEVTINQFLNIFNYCLKSLRYEFQRIINKSFMNVKYKYWWVEEYSKSTFYRKRNKAITSFVRLFEFIYENFNSVSVNPYFFS